MLFVEDGEKAEKTANVPLSNTAKEVGKASEAELRKRSFLFLSFLYLIARKLQICLQILQPWVFTWWRGLSASVSRNGCWFCSQQISWFFAGKPSEFPFVFANP